MKIELRANAKINLFLDILAKLPNGYHSLFMVMQSVSLADTVTVQENGEGIIRLTCSEPALPTDSKNIAYRAAQAFLEEAGLSGRGVDIHIEKNIPFEAGLAGGSADGAGVIVGLDRLFETDMGTQKLCDIGLKIGSDVPFCIAGGTMLSQHTGGILSHLPPLKSCFVVLAKPATGVSTARAYGDFDSASFIYHPNKVGMLDAAANADFGGICRQAGNVFEQTIEVPERVRIKSIMRRHGSSLAQMSGSGPTVFGLFESESDAEKCRAELEKKQAEAEDKLREIMYVIPNIIDPSVPIGPDDSCNVEVERFGEAVVPDFPIPYHTEIMESFNGIDLDAARRVAGNGFYYLMGDIARLHSAVIAYARDFMIDRGFTYVIPPYMIRSDVVTGVMSFAEMDSMMYKIEGEDLYLVGTSEHSMIGKFIDQILPEAELPLTLTSYSPCFRKEKGAHGIEERGVYRIHQFEKQEMIVVCKPEDSMMWYDKLWKNTVDLFRSMDIPVRTLECCSGDLADLKVKSVDVEAWSPRQKKYFEVGSCSNLGDAQARRLRIRVNGENGKYLAHTLNNTVVAPPRMLIAFLENNLQADGSVRIPEALRPYMGGKEVIVPKK